jgi:hypothetical protein
MKPLPESRKSTMSDLQVGQVVWSMSSPQSLWNSGSDSIDLSGTNITSPRCCEAIVADSDTYVNNKDTVILSLLG